MIRNHLFDPENSPPPKAGGPAFFNPSAYDNGSPSKPSEDPWYSGNGRESPMYSYGSYGNGGDQQQYPQQSYAAASTSFIDATEDDYDNEPPLLEELGIRFDHIWSKTHAVINLKQDLSEHILDDTDLAGPIFFCLLLGACLLLSGKIQFGYIYGFSVFGCVGMHTLLNLLYHDPVDVWLTCSVLGYSILPVVILAAITVLFRLTNLFGLVIAGVAIAWSTYAATRLFHAKLNLTEQYWLVAYPCMLLYSCFVLITIF